MSGRTERTRRAVTFANIQLNQALKHKKSELYGQFLQDARRMPFRHRWTLAWSILRGQKKQKVVSE